MKEGFRQSQAWLHTWSGLVLGWLLFAIFLTGTASYFQDEINHWMHPERHQLERGPLDLDKAVAELQRQAPNVAQWTFALPNERTPVLEAFWPGGERRFSSAALDPASGAVLPKLDTQGGNFFYRFHFQLWHIDVLTARYLVGVATMFMFVALISGIITHKKIFKDFFTLRPRKGQRSWLDGHNVSAVMALPFYLMITFTGLVIFVYLYMPWGIQAQYGDDSQAFFNELFPRAAPLERSGVAAPVPSLTPFLDKAREQWNGIPAENLTLFNPGDANARIELTPDRRHSISGTGPRLLFDINGNLLQRQGELKPIAQASRMLVGLHLGHYAEPLLRWLYFLSGLAGSFMIASGLVLWVVKRTAQAKGEIDFGLRLVQILNVGAVAGLPIAMASFLWANRLLPVDLAQRGEWEIHAFFATWGLALLHPLVRSHKRAWVEQLGLAALLFAALPLLDLFTVHAQWPRSLAYSEWLVTGVELTSLALGATLAWLSWKVARHQPQQKAARVAKPAKAAPVAKGSASAPECLAETESAA
ncbi:PepSY domain-containing protein [Pseudomonas sp. PDM14]|uniref:PepSY-associated TM helix domain-containing protein n=1 Tax=Pseudomonas sp. PDM14 TaxID=2769288 RepID=UPI00178567EA|nr:PepSY-associated TM helix domain-containing protein [Pseudomonas sp. PDM14]MBD9481967.1 PepSY domain-containing protein [Pseudomonas sp. PDM14]